MDLLKVFGVTEDDIFKIGNVGNYKIINNKLCLSSGKEAHKSDLKINDISNEEIEIITKFNKGDRLIVMVLLNKWYHSRKNREFNIQTMHIVKKKGKRCSRSIDLYSGETLLSSVFVGYKDFDELKENEVLYLKDTFVTLWLSQKKLMDTEYLLDYEKNKILNDLLNKLCVKYEMTYRQIANRIGTNEHNIYQWINSVSYCQRADLTIAKIEILIEELELYHE